jgi:hypothetical protein
MNEKMYRRRGAVFAWQFKGTDQELAHGWNVEPDENSTSTYLRHADSDTLAIVDVGDWIVNDGMDYIPIGPTDFAENYEEVPEQ